MIELTEIITIELTTISTMAEQQLAEAESDRIHKEERIRGFMQRIYASDDVKVDVKLFPLDLDEQKRIREENEQKQREAENLKKEQERVGA